MTPAILDVEPAWDIAKIFPAQGTWAEEDYLLLPGNRLVEYSHGIVEVLSMPSPAHQMIVLLLYRLLFAFVQKSAAGRVLIAPTRVKLWSGKFREPDLIFMSRHNRHRMRQQYWDGADLVMEVVSPDDPTRDLETKRREYAQAGIPEYWLVNPLDETITVFTLPENASVYAVHGVYDRSGVAESALLPGFTVDVDACFAEGEQ
jgi:Uma2 family endonuclease